MYRLYRLPGSKENWHIDTGPGTRVFNAQGFVSFGPLRTIDVGVDKGMVPHAWLELAAPGFDLKTYQEPGGKVIACWKNWNLFHSHVCSSGHRFVHHDSMAGNEAAHHCPQCGEFVNKQHEMNLPAPEGHIPPAFRFDWKRGLTYA
jgi:hypothetical protein